MTRIVTRLAIGIIIGVGTLATWPLMNSQPALRENPPTPQPQAPSSQTANAQAGKAPAGGGTDTLHDCGSVTRIASVSAVAALAPTPWTKPLTGRASRGSRPMTASDLIESAAAFGGSWPIITADLTATVALTVGPEDFVAKGTRLEFSAVDVRGIVPGLRKTGSGTVVIRPGATFRIRFEMTASPLPAGPRVTFEASCRAPCRAGERRCAADGICYAHGPEYCSECDHHSSKRCACVGLDGSDKPDGTSCIFALTGDLLMNGQCWAGECGSRPQ
jgi:hypothetical protein